VSDEAAIRATLHAYEAAYSTLDADAVVRVYPSVNAAALRRSFRDLNGQSVQIEPGQIAVNGSTATVSARVRQSFTPKAGSGRSDVVNSTFRLQKVNGGWLSVERR
jgi:hypothetical protein